jgi:Fur family transcriptional regulator, ferric uptake regulator
MTKKLYNSSLRTQIYEIICTAKSPISAKEIIDHLSMEYAIEVNKTSIYRQLEALQELKQIKSLELSIDKQTRYETTKTPHVHFVCINCEKVVCLPDGAVSLNLENLENGYKIQNYNLELTGICKNC